MKCPLCCEFVPNEELLQDHYLTTCPGLADESEDELCLNKKKFQYISPTTTDTEIYFLSTFLDTPQVTLLRVSDDLYQSDEIIVPEGTFEGQLVVGEDVLSVAPFTTTGSIITLHVSKQEFDTWSTHSSRSSRSVNPLIGGGGLRHSLSMSSLSSQNTGDTDKKKSRRRTLSDQSTTSQIEVHDVVLSDSSLQNSDSRVIMAERTSSKDSIDKGEKTKAFSRRKRRHRRFVNTTTHEPQEPELCLKVQEADVTIVNNTEDLINGMIQEKEVQDLKAEISKLRIENRKQAKELNTLSKVIDGPLAPHTETEILKREKTELKAELSELRQIMLRQERNHTKKIDSYRADPVEDWKKNQMDKLQRQLLESEQRAEEATTDKVKLEEELSRAKDKISQLRETRDTLRSTNDNMTVDMKKVSEKLENEISELHSKYLAQSRELSEAEKMGQSADNMRGLVERLTIENEELARQNTQLSLHTAEFESMSEKLKNKVSSLEIELEYKKKRDAEEEETRRWGKKEAEQDELRYMPRRQTPPARMHPLISKTDDMYNHNSYKSSVASQLNFNDQDDIPTSTPNRKPGYFVESNRKTDFSVSRRGDPSESFRKPDDYLTESNRKPDYLQMETKRNPEYGEYDFEPTPAENHYDAKYSKPFSYTKPPMPEDDDTYREALAIVEKYKKLDMNSECAAPGSEETAPKDYSKWSGVYDRVKSEPTEPQPYNERQRTNDMKWGSNGTDENAANYNNTMPGEESKAWNSTAWLRQNNLDSTSGGYNPAAGYAPATLAAGYAPATLSEPEYTRSTRRSYASSDNLRASYCGRSYNMGTEKNNSKVRVRESDDETDQIEKARPTKGPQNVSEVQLGSRVVFKRGSELERGTVRYAGRLIGKDGQYVGIELGTNTGNHDGTYQSHTYFKCKPKRGIFIPINKVQLVYPSH